MEWEFIHLFQIILYIYYHSKKSYKIYLENKYEMCEYPSREVIHIFRYIEFFFLLDSNTVNKNSHSNFSVLRYDKNRSPSFPVITSTNKGGLIRICFEKVVAFQSMGEFKYFCNTFLDVEFGMIIKSSIGYGGIDLSAMKIFNK